MKREAASDSDKRIQRISAIVQDLRSSTIVQHTAAFTANTGANAVFGYIYWQALNHLLSAASVGVASAAIAVCTALAGTASLGVNYSIVYARSRWPENFRGISNAALIVVAVASFVLSTVFVTGIPIWSPKLGEFYSVRGAIVVTLIVSGIAIALQQDFVFMALGRSRTVVYTSLFTIVSRSLLLLPLIFVSETSGALITFALGSWSAIVAAGVILRPSDRRADSPMFDFVALIRLATYSRDSYVITLTNVIAINLIPVLTLNLLGPVRSAHFYIAWMLAYFLYMVPGAVSSAVFVDQATSTAERSKQCKHALRLSLWAALLGGAGLLLIGPVVLATFGHDYLKSGMAPLVLLILAAIPMSYYGVAKSILRLSGQMRPLVSISVLTAIVTVAGAAVGSRFFGLSGIALAWLCGQVVGSSLWTKAARTLKEQP